MTDEKAVTPFYAYLKSFGPNEHFWEYLTVLTAKKIEGKLGAYYAIDFQRGEKLKDEQLQETYKNIKEVHQNTLALDSFYGKPVDQAEQAFSEIKEDGVQYPEDDIHPEDVPF